MSSSSCTSFSGYSRNIVESWVRRRRVHRQHSFNVRRDIISPASYLPKINYDKRVYYRSRAPTGHPARTERVLRVVYLVFITWNRSKTILLLHRSRRKNRGRVARFWRVRLVVGLLKTDWKCTNYYYYYYYYYYYMYNIILRVTSRCGLVCIYQYATVIARARV